MYVDYCTRHCQYYEKVNFKSSWVDWRRHRACKGKCLLKLLSQVVFLSSPFPRCLSASSDSGSPKYDQVLGEVFFEDLYGKNQAKQAHIGSP